MPRIRGLIGYYGVHRQEGPVDIDGLITEKLKIKLRYADFDQDEWIFGFSKVDEIQTKKRFIVINQAKPYRTQRFVKGHELGHIWIHPPEDLPLMCNPLYESKALEREADYFAAYLLVPKYALESIRKYGNSFDDIALGLEVPRELVHKRFEIYMYQNKMEAGSIPNWNQVAF
ncbi:MAG: ImmA/IrrE family metallo-endopeptidase [Chloroflexi bacterium]|nr:ImmA/IrrE family metallo-endopeptidase [Chloroflexota bacterium]